MELMYNFAMMRLGQPGFRFVGTEFECALRAVGMMTAHQSKQKLVVKPRLYQLVFVKVISAYMEAYHKTTPIMIVGSNATDVQIADSKKTTGRYQDNRKPVRDALKQVAKTYIDMVTTANAKDTEAILSPPPSARPWKQIPESGRKRKQTELDRAGKRPKKLFTDLL